MSAAPATLDIVGRPMGPPQSRIEGNQAIDAATAAALIGAISSEFGERDVQVKLDRVVVMPTSLVQRDVDGEGRLLIGRDAQWIPFKFRTLYDTVNSSADHPTLVIGGEAAGQPIALQSALGQQLSLQVNRRLRIEFQQQPAQFAADSVRQIAVGSHYRRIEAIGVARFGSDGSTHAGVEALYDQRTGEWLRVRYELGPTANNAAFAGGLASR